MEASVASTRFVPAGQIEWRTTDVLLPPRSDAGYTVSDYRAKMSNAGLRAAGRIGGAAMPLAFVRRSEVPIRLSSLRMGDIHVLHLPGESMIEFQLYAQKLRPKEFVAVAAYGDCGPAYVCTAAAFDEGGYEPSASAVAPESEAVLKGAIRRLLGVADESMN